MSHKHVVSLVGHDWDAALGGWYCSLLRIPGTQVVGIHIDGKPVDTAAYEVDPALAVIRLSRKLAPTSKAKASIELPSDLVTKTAADRLKLLAIILTFAAAVLSSGATIAVESIRQNAEANAAIGDPNPAAGLRVISDADDAPIGELIAKASAGSLLTLSGINFHHTANNRSEDLIAAVERGARIRVLVTRPRERYYEQYSKEYDHDKRSIQRECEDSLHDLLRIRQDVRSLRSIDDSIGRFEVRLTDYIPGQRLYWLEHGNADVLGLVVPLARGISSSDSPVLVVEGASGIASHFRHSLEVKWESLSEEVDPSSISISPQVLPVTDNRDRSFL